MGFGFQVPSGVQTMSSVYRAVASGAAFLFSGLSKVFDSRSEDHHGGHTAERNTGPHFRRSDNVSKELVFTVCEKLFWFYLGLQ